MRLSAVIDSPGGMWVHDHVGWAFEQPVDFQAHAGRHPAVGLSAGQRVMYVAGSDIAGPMGVPRFDEATINHHGMAELGGYAVELAVTAVDLADRDSVAAMIARFIPMADPEMAVRE
jgi:hypothetical protein